MYLNFHERAPEIVVLLLLLDVSSSRVKSGSSGAFDSFFRSTGAALLCRVFSSLTGGMGEPGAVGVGWVRSLILMSPLPAELFLIMLRKSARLLFPLTFIRPIIFLKLAPDMLASSSSVGSSEGLLFGVLLVVGCVVVGAWVLGEAFCCCGVLEISD